ncbi:uroporphyrinogen-III C-methyltransferase [Peptococcus simiae]|uniref:uroporphyrinogen-III C-methyltransferase n=1 Tax=Peptococcus simiae TaxID=1643805 RepID=UPI003980D42F
MNKGIVYLVGAGPGDVGLLTLKGLKAIQEADVIVYDRLANPRLLSFAKPGCEMIYCGKTPDHHTLKQEEINALLVDLAGKHQVVTRLKGGDPFVFGRGGEEGEALYRAGYPFEVVPGITSAIAVPAYAGIPVTHRHLTSTFTVITGHEDPTKDDSQINWQRLGEDPGTLIFLMGVGRLQGIVQQLMRYGKVPETPVALIRWGTRPEQATVTGTLDTIVDIVEKAGFTSPAIIIIGEVVKMRDTLAWFEQKPLFGQRILVTRAREQASALSEQIEALGGEAVEAPMIHVQKPKDEAPLLAAIEDLARYQWIIFTSTNGVRCFLEALMANGKDVRALADAKLCAIGTKTAQVLLDKGLRVEVVPEVFRAEAIAEALQGRIASGDEVLIPRSSLGRQVLIDELEKMGATVHDVVTYETVEADLPEGGLIGLLEARDLSAVTFTSSSTVHNFMKLLGNRLDLLENLKLVSIGPITTSTLAKYDLKPDVEAEVYTIDGVVNALKTL